MKIAAVTKLKQGDIYLILRRLGWTQAELSRRTGINQAAIGRYLNLKQRPSEDHADRIAVALAREGEYIDVVKIWPESFRGFGVQPTFIQVKDVPIRQLKNVVDQKRLPGGSVEGASVLKKIMKRRLSSMEVDIMFSLFFSERSPDYCELAERYGITRVRVGQIVQNSIHKLRKLSGRDKYLLKDVAEEYGFRFEEETSDDILIRKAYAEMNQDQGKGSE